MAFTDTELATAMSNNLVQADIMTAAERTELLEDPTENNVRAKLTADQLGRFQTYWDSLGEWMTDHGGNIAQTTGNNVPGRTGGNPVGLGPKAIYNDAFRDVNEYLGQQGFSAVKAVSNQLRFISYYNDD